MPAFRPPTATLAERMAHPPEFIGEIVTDPASGQSFQGQVVDGEYVWRQMSGLPPTPDVGDVLMAVENGVVETASLYPYILSKLVADLAAMMERTNV